ncbi:hypothetical protein E2C01_020905 [Portunus trituberculatus]|uniref:Uncharacterized protein n=1 Tax=Portunus trituberculatus TaxID=210409 RepID=A0A5B7E3J6_PORTR|nr:hypothetical protein [Portunus trituberculatus]
MDEQCSVPPLPAEQDVATCCTSDSSNGQRQYGYQRQRQQQQRQPPYRLQQDAFYDQRDTPKKDHCSYILHKVQMQHTPHLVSLSPLEDQERTTVVSDLLQRSLQPARQGVRGHAFTCATAALWNLFLISVDMDIIRMAAEYIKCVCYTGIPASRHVLPVTAVSCTTA